VLLRRYVQKHYPEVDAHAKPNRNALSKRWDALWFELTNVFQQGAGVILGTVITRDAGALSVYGVYHMVTVGLWGVLKMVTTGIYSIFGNLLVSKDKAAFQKAYSDFECLYFTAVTILFGTAAVLIVPFVNLYTHGVTDVNYNVPVLGLLIILEALATQSRIPLNLMISSSGRFTEVRGHWLTQVGVTIAAGAALGLLGLQWGVVGSLCGVVAGVCVGDLVRTGLLLHFVPAQIIGASWKPSALRLVRMLLTVIVIAAPCLILIDPPRRFFSWAMYAVVMVLYAAVVSLGSAWLFDRRTVRSLMGRLQFLLRKFH